VCRGFFDVAKHEGLLAVAERLGIVEFTPLDK
jgi:predicted DNA binding protein